MYLDPFNYRGLRLLRTLKLDMELAIPITSFDPDRVKWGEPRSGPFRKIIPFTYHDEELQFNNLIIALHPLKIVEVDKVRNRLVLEEPNNVSLLSRLEKSQTNTINELKSDLSKWVDEPNNYTRCPLQTWIRSKILTLYLSPDPLMFDFYTQNGLEKFSETSIKPGDSVRIVIKIHGLSLQMTDDDVWTGKSRIQHQILQIYKVSTATD